jgi:hypothetical protein
MGTSSSYNAPTSGAWPNAKRTATRFAKQGGTGTVTPRQVVSAYLTALGGAAAAARRAAKGREAAQRLGAFFGTVADRGLDVALQQIGLANLIGRDTTELLEALVDRLAGPGGPLEEADARAAMLRVLQEELEEPAALDGLDQDRVGRIVESFLVEYIYERMLQEIGDRLENGAMTVEDAMKSEDDIRVYVVANVQLELAREEPLTVWDGPEGQELVGRLMEDAYAQLE